MKKNAIVSLADSNYFNLLNELIDSIKQFNTNNSVAICILDAGLEKEQLNKLSVKVDEIKSANWDIQVSSIKVRGKEWLKSQVSRAFIPKYFPGYTLSVYQNGIESYYSQKGYDDIFNKIEYSRDSIFRIYSMTKPIVSTAIMQLIENNQISLDDNVDLYIPELKNLKYFNSSEIETIKRQINIKDLLTHTSGLTYGFQGQSEVDRKYKEKNINNIVDTTLKTQEIINELSRIPLEFSPGDFYNYSISIDVLGFIIERVSNYSLQEYLDINVFEKLDMKDTSFILDKSKKDRMAKCYRWNEKYNF